MQVTLHPVPRPRDVVREQIRIVGLGLRREALVIAIVLGIVTLVIAIDIARGNAYTWFDSDDWFPIGVAAFLFPFAVWRRDRRFGPAFLWTLPVDRRRLALAKVFAGWVWLMATLAVVISWQFVLAFFSGVPDAETLSPAVVGGATAFYLFGSALVLGLRHPLRWLIGTAAVCFLLGFVNETIDILLSGRPIQSALGDASRLWLSLPGFARWALATFLSLAAGLAALWAAVSRHGERRRH